MRPRTKPTSSARRATLRVACCLVLGLLASDAPVAAQQTDPAAAPRGSSPSASVNFVETLSRRGDLTLRDTTLESALFTISELWGVNIVAGDVQGEVNGVFKDAPLRDILDSILLSNGYAYRPVGGSLVVSRLQELGQINPFFVSETISVGAAEVGEAVEAARLMSTPQGQVRALPSAGAILVVDFPDRVKKIRQLLQQIDSATRGLGQPGAPGGGGPQQLEVAYFRTHYVPADVAGQALDVVLSTEGRVATIDDDDRLLVVDYAANVEMVRAVLARIDRPRPQVNIKALIYDIGLSDIEELGVNWDGITNGQIIDGVATTTGDGLRFQTQTKAPFDGNGSGFTFYSISSNVNIQALVLALQSAEDSRLLADPNVTVMDNEKANIESVQEIPFQQLTQTGAGGNIGTTAFKPVGIKLDVTPKIANDHTIDMTVVPEFSRLTGFTPNDNQPIIDTRKATTRVRIGNGQTLMIAGLRQRNDVGDFSGVPLLKDIRFVGHLFRARNTQIEESELVVFVTPEIVGYTDPLGERDRLSADTIRCRLDHIPAAEGCPPCGPGCYGGGCHEGHGGPLPAEGAEYVVPESVSSPGPEPVDALDLNAPLPSGDPVEVAPAVTPMTEDITPETANRPVGLNYPKLVQGAPRRLPPIGGALDGSTNPDAAEPARALRVAYGDRFRAPGGVYDKASPEGRPESDSQEDAETPKRGLRDLLFWR